MTRKAQAKLVGVSPGEAYHMWPILTEKTSNLNFGCDFFDQQQDNYQPQHDFIMSRW